MASRGLGTLTLDLIAKIGGFVGPLDQAARTADKRFKQMNDSAERFGKGLGKSLKAAAAQFLAFVGVTASVSAAIGGIKNAIDRADALRDLSIRVGASTEALSAFGYAATQTGTDIDALAKGMLILSKNATLALNPKSKQSGLFAALGVSKSDLGDIEKLLPSIADKFKLLEDGTQKAALAQQLFGRSGAELIEFLNQGSDGLQQMGDRARELGIIIDSETAASADEFNDKLADLKAAAGGFATEVASALLPQLTELVDWAVEFVREGGGAEDAVAGLSDGFNDLQDAVSAIAGAGSGFISYLGEVRKNIADTERTLGDATLSFAKFMAVTDAQMAHVADLQAKRKKLFQDQPGGGASAPTMLPTFTVTGNVDALAKQEAARIKASRDLQNKINGYLGNPTGRSGGGAKKSGKSDAQREAEALLESYQRMEATYREQIALVGDVTEVEKLRYELANGEGKKFSEQQKATLLGLAAQKEAVEAANEQLEEGKRLTESLLAPFEQVNVYRAEALELLRAGTISQETYNRALEAQLTPAEEMLESLAFEAELLGKTREEQELLTAARLLGAEAATVQGQAAIQALKDFQEQAKATEEQIALMDGVRDAFGDFFTSIIDGSKSAKEALKDLVTDIIAQITRLMVQKAIEQLFGAYGTTQGGAAGGGWGAALASMFGGQRAGGGFVVPGQFYEVGENNRPEIFMAGNKQFMIPGNAGMVTPMRGGGAGTISQTFVTSGLETRRTSERKAQLAGRAAQRAMARNGR